MLLSKSFLNEEKTWVKYLEDGLYGIQDVATGLPIIPPRYEYIFAFEEGRAVVLKAGKFLQIDLTGKEHFDQDLSEYERLILKGDRCPDCSGTGCDTCQGLGFIPVGGDYSDMDF